MFLFIITEDPNILENLKQGSDVNQEKYGRYFDYICKLCPQRTQKHIYSDQLKSRLRKKFRIDDLTVKAIIAYFVNKNALIVAFDDSVSINLLSNTTRKKIHDLIEEYPGVYSNIFIKFLGLGSRQVLWHISFLLEFNIIEYLSFGKIKAYGLIEIDKKLIMIGYVILKDSLRELLKCLLDHPNGSYLGEISELLGKPKNSTLYTLNKLKQLKILILSQDNKKKYSVDRKYIQIMNQTLERHKKKFP
ncbi:hypothetical protein DSAG12_02248 [Promethearchaeum syntrophicum]|uniref:Uncharacterized protein n=1 Tax=Promethearchaeum syntrophicum TaxID=2594042 RepID=A0A5B9DB91_9ARCH|nr:hypothetical protein [Candidatus Prometheoarchaeum syntrophicum]